MTKAIATAVLLSLAGASFAMAQGAGTTPSAPNPPASASPASPGSRNAPVGHRQPRANEVPSAAEKNYMESPEDKALDRKIKSICRGC
jgi:hypothetical protein